MGLFIQIVAIVGAVGILSALWIAKRKRYHLQKHQQPTPANITVYELSFSNLKVMTAVDHRFIPIEKTTLKSLFEIDDMTEVDGRCGLTRVPHVPRGTGRVAMFDDRRTVICLSRDKKALLHQEMDSDGGRIWMYLLFSQDRLLDEAFELLRERAKKRSEASSQRRAR